MSKNTPIPQLFIPFVIAAVTMVVVGTLFVQHQKDCLQCLSVQTFTPDVIRHFIGGFGPWAIVIYVLLYMVNTVSILPPIAFMH